MTFEDPPGEAGKSAKPDEYQVVFALKIVSERLQGSRDADLVKVLADQRRAVGLVADFVDVRRRALNQHERFRDRRRQLGRTADRGGPASNEHDVLVSKRPATVEIRGVDDL